VVLDPDRTSNKFHRFCILLDYLRSLHPDWTRESIFNAAIEDKVGLPPHWLAAHNFCAEKGVYGYQTIKTQAEREADRKKPKAMEIAF
jgi:hypothetical protein